MFYWTCNLVILYHSVIYFVFTYLITQHRVNQAEQTVTCELTTFNNSVSDICTFVADNYKCLKKCLLGYNTVYEKKKKVPFDISKQIAACILRVRKFGHVNAEVPGRRKRFDYLECLQVLWLVKVTIRWNEKDLVRNWDSGLRQAGANWVTLNKAVEGISRSRKGLIKLYGITNFDISSRPSWSINWL